MKANYVKPQVNSLSVKSQLLAGSNPKNKGQLGDYEEGEDWGSDDMNAKTNFIY